LVLNIRDRINFLDCVEILPETFISIKEHRDRDSQSGGCCLHNGDIGERESRGGDDDVQATINLGACSTPLGMCLESGRRYVPSGDLPELPA
jgi:hypothetical protein